MAESSDGQDKSEEPTAKRLADARQKGEVARSKELTTTVMLLSAAAGLFIFGAWVVEAMMNIARNSFSLDREQVFNTSLGLNSFMESLGHALTALAPFLIVMIVSAIVGSIAMSGWNFSTKALAPKPSKMNPLKGIKRMGGPQALMELGKAIAKFAVIMGLGVTLLWWFMDEVLALAREPLRQAIAHGSMMVIWVFLLVSLAMIIISIADVPFQAWNHRKQLKMTKQEVKQENKDVEGSPELKARIRQAQMEVMVRRMMQAVPDADVVITNPTHFSVAIKYDQDNMRAPIVVAKGADLVAFEIRRVAQEHNVPILSAPPLARAIYHTTELDQEIPEGLYLAVAQVLAFVFHLRKKPERNTSSSEINMPDVEVPDDMHFDADGNTIGPKGDR